MNKLNYIGKKDIYNREIYEGCILKISGYIKDVGYVIYDKESCRYVIRCKRNCRFDPYYDYCFGNGKYNDNKCNFEYENKYEIIGNIKNNKNLLD